jgi:hypothetical protein
VGADELEFVGGDGAIGVVGVDERIALHGGCFWADVRVEGDLRSGQVRGSGDQRTTQGQGAKILVRGSAGQ